MTGAWPPCQARLPDIPGPLSDFRTRFFMNWFLLSSEAYLFCCFCLL